MRGAFVACFGAEGAPGDLERVAAAMRWHRGIATFHAERRFCAALLADGSDGPHLETDDGHTRLVHGDFPRPLAGLLRDGRRFAALEYNGRSLAAARDPLGLSPLFYRRLEDAVWLSTEIAPLMALGHTPPDLAALAAQAALVPLDETTGYCGILRVLPGFVLEIAEDLTTEQHCFWRPEKLFGSYRGSRAEAQAELHDRFVEAVARTMAAQSGILLSGGIDSAAITSVASSLAQGFLVVHVGFSGFGDAAEERHARTLTDALGLELDVVPGEVGPWDPKDDLRTSVVPYLSPPSFTAHTALARLAVRGAAVALDGNDGDGVLGYTGREWGELALTGGFRRLAELSKVYGRREVLHRVLEDIVPPELRLRRLRGRAEPPPTYLQYTERYFDSTLRTRMRKIDHERWRNPRHEWRARQLRQVLPVTTIRNEEHELRGARFGVDMRHPFADRDLVEFLISLPASVKSDPFRSKDLLRHALAAQVPVAALERPDKSEYIEVREHRVDAGRCVDWIRGSRVRLPHVNYEQLYRDADVPGGVPLGLLIFLARAHVFAAVEP